MVVDSKKLVTLRLILMLRPFVPRLRSVLTRPESNHKFNELSAVFSG